MKTCTTCGSTVSVTARFCGDCGAATPLSTSNEDALAAVTVASASAAIGDAHSADPPSDLSAFPPRQAASEPRLLAAFCTNCGQRLSPDARFCGACGTQSLTAIPQVPNDARVLARVGGTTDTWAAAQPIESPRYEPAAPTTHAKVHAVGPPPAAPTGAASASSGNSRGPWIGAAVALVVLIGAAAAVAYIIGGRSSSSNSAQKSQTSSTSGVKTTSTVTPAQFTKQIMVVVRADQGALSGRLAHVASLGVGESTLARAKQAATQLRADVGRLQTRLISAPAGAQQVPLLRQALSAHRAYASSVVALTSSAASFTMANASQVKQNASTADSLYSRLGAGNVTFQQEPRLVLMASRIALQNAQQTALRGYLNRIDSILAYSAQGRKDLGTITQNVLHQSTDPQTGAQLLQSVVDNRTTVLNQIEQMQTQISADPRVPSQIGSLLGQLHTAISNSLSSDEAYQSWAAGLPYSFNYQYYNSTYDAALGQAGTYDVAASSAKQDFVATYDPLASSVGLRSWSSSGF